MLHDNRDAVEELIGSHSKPSAPTAPTAPTATELEPELEDSPAEPWRPLHREHLDEEQVRTLCASLRHATGRVVYDPQALYWEQPNYSHRRVFEEHPDGGWRIQTNDQGFRKSVDVLAQQPDLRIIATGDSHTAGIVPNEEQFVNVLESRLRELAPSKSIEGLNAGKGGYSFYNYIGVLEKLLPLKPDVFVMAVFGGNDFADVVDMYRYFEQIPRTPPVRDFRLERFQQLQKQYSQMYAQGLNQIGLYHRIPAYRGYGLVVARRMTAEIHALCQENGVRFVCVYIPPFHDGQPELLSEPKAKLLELMGWTEEDLKLTDQLADSYLGSLEKNGIDFIDMRPVYREQAEPCYWLSDLHINTLGHSLIAEALLQELEALVRD